MLSSRILLLAAVLLTSACSSPSTTKQPWAEPAREAQAIAEREVHRREGWVNSTVFARGIYNASGVIDQYQVMVLASDKSLKGKMLVGPSVAVWVSTQGKILNYKFFPAHN